MVDTIALLVVGLCFLFASLAPTGDSMQYTLIVQSSRMECGWICIAAAGIMWRLTALESKNMPETKTDKANGI